MDTYKATNTSNGKFYIGSTINFEERRKAHLTSKKNYPFQNALRANPNGFIWEVWSDDSEEPTLEQALLDMWFGKEQCYNLSPNADRPPTYRGESHPCFGRTGAKHPNYGKRNPNVSESNRQRTGEKHLGQSEKMSGEGNPNYGKKFPEVSERNSKRTGELNSNSKKVEVTYPNGYKEKYPCASAAAKSIGCSSRSRLAKWARGEHTVKRGEFSGYSFRYL
jgi:group I intron endonuclease